MEVILKQDVINLGHKDDVVNVKNGYATNYLIPQGMAIMATPSAKKMHAENIRQRAHKEAKIRQDAQALAAKLNLAQVKVLTKVSKNGKVFGSVNNIQVAEALAAQGIEIDRRNITFANTDSLKEVGVYEAIVKIYRDITATVKVEVAGEE
ncbi:MAG: 50S ribosomal protein L9 [Bacteroidales bacterium]|jgi:large subunit ribosomal protein L9|nr:50S ribosomal protein L9 [Bacteroidales bacterium]MDD4256661.1 50S ribosomal protein L9 [Bacteroidales bacterium]MDD4655181.1 50S ribosomal protein L9 [Bacteroidales bacterium]MDD4827158.1 50S ribosomal protein L9 [Bacteroidales bacterium]HNY23149.1 50S ribosomal protein L9 [Bacteroidales bacterium]